MIAINSYTITLVEFSLISVEGKDWKNGFIISTNINQLIYYLKNFVFLLAFLLKSACYLHLKWKSTIKELKNNRSLALVNPNLPLKILYFMHYKTQAFLR